ncbi:MAG: hypothetical protein ACFCVH_12255 [Alphaproteobacteria bacterium]
MQDVQLETAGQPASAPRASRLYAVGCALAAALLLLSELLIADAALTWVAVGLWELPASVGWVVGGIGAALCLWAAWRLFLSAYRIERGA